RGSGDAPDLDLLQWKLLRPSNPQGPFQGLSGLDRPPGSEVFVPSRGGVWPAQEHRRPMGVRSAVAPQRLGWLGCSAPLEILRAGLQFRSPALLGRIQPLRFVSAQDVDG